MTAAAQFKSAQLRDLPAEDGPSRLICCVRLVNRESPQRLGFRQRPQERTTPSTLLGQEYDSRELQRSGREMKTPATQVYFEFPDSTASADDRRVPDHRAVKRRNSHKKFGTSRERPFNGIEVAA